LTQITCVPLTTVSSAGLKLKLSIETRSTFAAAGTAGADIADRS
jgi:hypothetical protein